MSNTTKIPDRSDRRAFELHRHSVEMANIEKKPLLYKARARKEWKTRAANTLLNWDAFDYRLAPEAPAVTPWTFETCPVGTVLRHKTQSVKSLITEAILKEASLDSTPFTYQQLLDFWEQLDGSPAGTVQPSAEQWPKWFRDGSGENVWKVNKDGSGTFYHKGKVWQDNPSGTYKSDNSLGKAFPQITAAEAEALIQKARVK